MARRRPLLPFDSHQVSRAVHGALLAMACAAAGTATAQNAQSAPATPAAQAEPRKAYSIAAGPLDEALSGFAAAAGVSITMPPALVQGKRSPGLQGSHAVREGFARLLAGSGLEAAGGSGGSYALRSSAIGGPVDSETSGSTLEAVTVTAQAERSATTEGTQSYTARAVTLGKGEQSLKDIPQSVSVLTRQRMDDQGLVDLRDAANSVTGIVGVKGVGPGMILSSRGFQIDAWQYDGVPVPRNMYSLGNWASEDTVFFDRLEVLRGASGLLQGTGSPGGAVNLVRKRGQAEKTLTLTGKAGSWDRYGAQLDAGGPLNAEGTLRGRVVIDEDRRHSFTDYEWSNTRSLYAALDYDLSPDTTVGIGVSNADMKGRPMLRGFPRYPDGRDIGLPRSVFTGAVWNHTSVEQTTLYADLAHRFNDNWKLKVSALGMNEKNSSRHQRMHGDVEADGSGLDFADWDTAFKSRKTGFDAYLNGRFEALSMQHEVTIGASYMKFLSNDRYARRFSGGGNIFAIDHYRPPQNYQTILAAGGRASDPHYDVRQKGIYGTWRAKLAEPLTAIVGARVSWYDYLYTVRAQDIRSTVKTSGEVTPYVGLVYALNKQWSAYASYTDVFEPQTERTAAGDGLKPIIGSNYELGVKGELMDGRLNTSLAVFRYDHKNRAVADYDAGYACDGWYCSKSSGKVRSQGIEAEVSGEIAPRLQLTAGYTFNTTKFLEDPDNKGKVFSQWTPKHMLRVWASYQLPGDWSKLSVGGGFTAQSHTLGYDRTYKVPGFTVWGARLAYQATPEVSLAVNINNIFDKRYYIPAFNETNGNNNYGDPRNVMFTVKYTPKL
ncbi:TonB-dependent receptor [Variovorax sp. KBW07]|uniref:TonB-dependent siderophore receptor n=1 Tax=Variovorax sp. KBW07 TaxID=2153358 RepID=UPI001C89732C|nr:TonB-dependent receptor [Variovorax sp. KBW07]